MEIKEELEKRIDELAGNYLSSIALRQISPMDESISGIEDARNLINVYNDIIEMRAISKLYISRFPGNKLIEGYQREFNDFIEIIKEQIIDRLYR